MTGIWIILASTAWMNRAVLGTPIDIDSSDYNNNDNSNKKSDYDKINYKGIGPERLSRNGVYLHFWSWSSFKKFPSCLSETLTPTQRRHKRSGHKSTAPPPTQPRPGQRPPPPGPGPRPPPTGSGQRPPPWRPGQGSPTNEPDQRPPPTGHGQKSPTGPPSSTEETSPNIIKIELFRGFEGDRSFSAQIVLPSTR